MTQDKLIPLYIGKGIAASVAAEIITDIMAELARETHPTGLTHQPQMTLRDYFAGQAITAINDYFTPGKDDAPENWAEWVAKNAYALAGEMMKARGE